MTSRRPTPQFPQELIDMIIDNLHDDSRALKACTLTARTWLNSSRLHLFYSLTVKEERLYSFLSFTTMLQESPHLATYIRRLRLCPRGTKSFVDMRPFISTDTLLLILSKLHRLHSLSLQGIDISSTNPYGAGSTTKQFRLYRVGLYNVTESALGRHLRVILRLFSRVDKLEIVGCVVEKGFPPILPMPLVRRSYGVNMVESFTMSLPPTKEMEAAVPRILCSLDFRNLHSLTLALDRESLESTIQILRLTGSALQHLTLVFMFIFNEPKLQYLLSDINDLRTFTISFYLDDMYRRASRSTWLSALDVISSAHPSKIVSITLSISFGRVHWRRDSFSEERESGEWDLLEKQDWEKARRILTSFPSLKQVVVRPRSEGEKRLNVDFLAPVARDFTFGLSARAKAKFREELGTRTLDSSSSHTEYILHVE